MYANLTVSPEELAAGKAKVLAEFKALPDESFFGDDNRAAEKLVRETFEKLEKLVVGADLEDILAALSEIRDRGRAWDYPADESIHIVYWAAGLETLDE